MDSTATPPLPAIPPCRITRWPNLYDVNGDAIETTWDAFFDELSTPVAYLGQTKHPGWSAAVLEPPARADENVVGMTAVVLDYDKSTTVEDALAHWREWYGFLHTSRRHTPESQRFRVILPLARIVTPDEYDIIWAWARELAVTAGQEVDESTKNPSRFWYLPGAKAIGHYRAERLGGAVVLDPDPILASHTEAVRIADAAEASASAPMPAGSSTSGRVKWIEKMLDAQIDAVSNAGKGHRNVTLNKCAYRVGQFVAGGDLSDAKARAALRTAALKAGLPEREIRGTLKSAFAAATKSPRYVPRTRPPLRLVPPGAPPFDDDWQPPPNDGSVDDHSTPVAATNISPSYAFERGDHAELCEATRTQIESQETPITYEDGDFWRYCPLGGYWKRFLTESVEHVARGYAGALICPPGGKPKVLNITSGACSGAARLLRNELVSRADRPSFQHAPRGVAFSNGFVTVDESVERAGEIRVVPHSPDNLARVGLPFAYDPEAKHPQFDTFLEELFADANEDDRACRVALLQEFLGASLMGLAPSLQRCLMVFGEGGNGKALALDTPIPTPNGWATQGSLRVGDELFDESGRPCRVVALSPIWTDRPCLRLSFSDGHQIVADRDHVWAVRTHKRAGNGTRTVTTGEISTRVVQRTRVMSSGRSVGHSATEYRWAIGVTKALRLGAVDVPVDPYILGYWLGDGNSRNSRVTCSRTDLAHLLAQITRAGYETGKPAWVGSNVSFNISVPGGGGRGRDSLQARLRSLGVLPRRGNQPSKKIPSQYLRGSFEQRLALLHGLMDSDGSTLTSQAQCEFTSVNHELALGVLELVRTLGLRPTVTTGRATLRGRYIGTKYRVIFTTIPGLDVFLLPRKRERCRPRQSELFRKVTACEPVASVPVRCIQVNSPSSLYLCGAGMVPTHNSELIKIARSIFPEEAQCSLSPQKWEERFALSMLVGKLANFCDEMPDKEIIGSEIFKGVITGNEQQTEFKGRDGFVMRPRAGHIFSANTLPATGDHSAGFYRRFVVLMLTRNFEEKDTNARRLDAAASVISAERNQIASWAVAGAAHAFKTKGYTIPSSSAETRSAWMIESDSVALWVRDCTMETKSESGLFSAEMYPAYQAWATKSGLRACSLVSFGRRLIARTPHRMLNGKNYYLVRIKA